MEMPAAEQRKREAWIGSESVREERGLKMGGWYAMIVDAGSESASSATRVVRLVSIKGRVKSGSGALSVIMDLRWVRALLTRSSEGSFELDVAAAEELLLDDGREFQPRVVKTRGR